MLRGVDVSSLLDCLERRMRFSFWRVLVLLLLLLPARLAGAADVAFPAPDTAVNQYGVTTYLDLARHFIPDIKPSDSGYVGKRHIPIRHIAGMNFANNDADTFGFYDISTVTMHAEGKQRLLVLLQLNQKMSYRLFCKALTAKR